MKRFLPVTFFLLLFAILFFLHLSKDSIEVQAVTASNIVISEIQIAGDGDSSANDEFIELYNPTDSAIDISNWSIQKETIEGSFTKKNFVSPASIPAYGFYLIAHAAFNGAVTPDLSHSSFILSSTGTTVFLVNNKTLLTAGNEASIVDKVAIGTLALNAEGTPFASIPTNNLSIERKASSLSSSSSMSIGAEDEFLGNGEDTDNNANDFVERTAPDPQNSNSEIELPFVPTPTPTNSPTPTPTNTPTPTPTSTPTPTPSSASDSSTSSDSSSASSSSCNDSKPGSAPTLLSATPGINSVLLHWSEASDPVSYYLVSYGLSSGVYTYGNPNVGGKGTTSYTVNGLSGSTTYYFKVRAGNGCTPGDFSNELSATPFGNEVTDSVAADFTEGVLGAEDEETVVSEKKAQKESVKVLTNSSKAQYANSSPVKIVWDFVSFSVSFVWRLITKIKFF